MADLADHILVIDRNPDDRERLVDYLRSKGYFVQVAESVHHAALLPEDSSPAIVFADLNNDELASLPYLKDAEKNIPVVVVSAAQTSGDVVACLRAGAADFILKPIQDLQNVDHVILGILDKIRIAQLNTRLQQELEERNLKLVEGIRELRLDQKAGLQVQKKMLPHAPKTFHDMTFDHCVKPSLYLSGDFLDYFKIDEHRALFYFADVSGHGASSAFVTVLLKNLTMRLKRNFKRGSSDALSNPGDFLKRVNSELIESDLDKHITIFVGHIDKRDHVLTYAIGGHFPLPIIKDQGKTEYLEGRGVALGLFPEPEFEIYRRKLEKNFSIHIFSDGILEIIEAESLEDKEKLLLDVVSKNEAGIESLLSSLGLDGIDELPDDIAVMSVHELGQ